MHAFPEHAQAPFDHLFAPLDPHLPGATKTASLDEFLGAVQRMKMNPFVVKATDVELLEELCLPGVILED